MLKSVFVVPTRGRPQNAARLLEAWEDTKAVADLYFVCDSDDWALRDYQKIDRINILLNYHTATGCVAALNMGVMTLLDDSKYDRYDYFGFLGDDNVPRTPYWDYLLRLLLPLGRNGIAYGNDLLQGANVPTTCLMTRGICEKIKGMAPGTLKHLYVDNFWKVLGTDLGNLHYSHDIIIEHLHPLARKAPMDDHYARVNSREYYAHDEAAFQAYIDGQDYKDLVASL
jgi:hypothetical protein